MTFFLKKVIFFYKIAHFFVKILDNIWFYSL